MAFKACWQTCVPACPVGSSDRVVRQRNSNCPFAAYPRPPSDTSTQSVLHLVQFQHYCERAKLLSGEVFGFQVPFQLTWHRVSICQTSPDRCHSGGGGLVMSSVQLKPLEGWLFQCSFHFLNFLSFKILNGGSHRWLIVLCFT